MFLRKSRLEPLPVTMSAVRMGERLLQLGADDSVLAIALAGKVGLSGSAALVAADEASAQRVRAASAGAGVLLDVRVSALSALPFPADAFDLVVVHGTRGLLSALDVDARLAALRESHRVLRTGGRLMIIEATGARGLKSLFQKPADDDVYAAAGGAVGALENSGFKAVRLLAEREGLKFSEGTKS